MSKDWSEEAIISKFSSPKPSKKPQPPTTPQEPPRRITIDDLAVEYDKVFAWDDADEEIEYFRKWDNRTFVVRGYLDISFGANPRVKAYAKDFDSEYEEKYVSLSLAPCNATLVLMKKSKRGPFSADFLFPLNTPIDSLVSRDSSEVIVQGTFSKNMTLARLIRLAREGTSGMAAIFTDCKIIRG